MSLTSLFPLNRAIISSESFLHSWSVCSSSHLEAWYDHYEYISLLKMMMQLSMNAYLHQDFAVSYHWLGWHKVQITANQLFWHATSFNGCLSGFVETFECSYILKLHICQLRYLPKLTWAFFHPPGKYNKDNIPICKELNICANIQEILVLTFKVHWTSLHSVHMPWMSEINNFWYGPRAQLIRSYYS